MHYDELDVLDQVDYIEKNLRPGNKYLPERYYG